MMLIYTIIWVKVVKIENRKYNGLMSHSLDFYFKEVTYEYKRSNRWINERKRL